MLHKEASTGSQPLNPQFSKQNSYIKAIAIFSSSSQHNHRQRNSMADYSSFVCEMLGSSTVQSMKNKPKAIAQSVFPTTHH